ncbi:NAD(P)/FAD-dependent oxidoreductase [Streptomyces sp. NRRL S-448]|uniref:NAD(P)/FAD-dependent oxidoreductase n=1 Tax=Streptomyces sp. NRRL S-448 TaxID=1463907 RepID=UPI00356A579E
MRIAVIGAGAVGLTVADMLAQSDAVAEVHLFDRQTEAAGGATSYAGASDVPHGWTERHRRLIETSMEWHRAVGADLADEDRYRHRTGTFWRSDDERSDARILGFAYDTPVLTTDARTGARGLLGDGYVIAPGRLARILLGRLRASGKFTARFGTAVEGPAGLADGTVLDASGGRDDFDAVVVAAGPWVTELLADLPGLSGLRTKQVYGYRFTGDPRDPLTGTVVDLEHGAFLFPQPTVPDSYAMSIKCDVYDVPVAEGAPSAEADEAAWTVARTHLGPEARLTARRIFVDTYTDGSIPLVADLSGGRRLVCVSGTHGSGIRLAPGLAREACDLLGVA